MDNIFLHNKPCCLTTNYKTFDVRMQFNATMGIIIITTLTKKLVSCNLSHTNDHNLLQYLQVNLQSILK